MAHENMSINKMRSELNLTDDQFSKLTALENSYKEKKVAIKADASLTQEQRNEKIRSLLSERRSTYKTLLNADQITKFEIKKNGEVKIKTKKDNDKTKIKTEPQR